MAGSAKTGDVMEAGRNNTANEPTGFWAEKGTFAPHWSVIAVGPAAAKDKRPDNPVIGIVAYGYKGDAAILGIGNQPKPNTFPNDPAYWEGSGTGGNGVVGQGGTGDLIEWDVETAGGMDLPPHPGHGILGIGGHWRGATTDQHGNTRDNRGGAGVVGIAGTETVASAEPPFGDAAGIGVYGYSGVSEGVRGFGFGEGVYGYGFHGPGGIFFSGIEGERGPPTPQLRLVPHQMKQPLEVENALQSVNALSATCLRKLTWAIF